MIAIVNSHYFKFEEDFVEENIRCIPMIVRMKLDICGIKMKLAEWSKLNTNERKNLADFPCETHQHIQVYKRYLEGLIWNYTKQKASILQSNDHFEWRILDHIPHILQEKLNQIQRGLSLQQWRNLSTLQRFALIKLSRPGHENANFPKAMQEFGLLDSCVLQ
jgi:hypothetical protein